MNSTERGFETDTLARTDSVSSDKLPEINTPVQEVEEKLPLEDISTEQPKKELEEIISQDSKDKEEFFEASLWPEENEKDSTIENLGGVHFEQDSNMENVWNVTLDKDIVDFCTKEDKEWNEGEFGFNENISDDFPYVMAPETSDKIFEKSEVLIEMMETFGLIAEPWNVKGDDTPYTQKLLHRDKVPDTIKPIFWNTDRIAEHLNKLDSEREGFLSVRSFGTGSGVAEKCLLVRLRENYGLTNVNLVSTDKSVNSIAAAAVNLAVWNETLSPNEKYEILVVNGEIPEELYKKNKTIVLQIADADNAIDREKGKDISYDALSLDNILPYLPQRLNNKILEGVIENKGDKGLFVTALGLDQGIKVELNKAFQYSQILLPIDLMKKFKGAYEKFGFPIHNGYWHKYDFSKRTDGSYLIDKVLSEGSAKMYTWIRKLIYNGKFDIMGKVTSSIDKATSLSSAKEEVMTPPWKTHVEYLMLCKSKGLQVNDIEAPLYPEKFGFALKDSEKFVYKKDGNEYSYDHVMDICRSFDPVVLRGSSLYIQ